MLLNPGAHNEPISSSLICTSLYNSAVAYEALSYTWGDHRHREEISLVTSETGERIEYVLAVTSSLHSALKSLRPQTGPARTLWIDAICIYSFQQRDAYRRSWWHLPPKVAVFLATFSFGVAKYLIRSHHV
jgi:Heterokaryon incompatibility protein (HET)